MKTTRSRWVILITILAALSLVAAACGDNDDTSASGDDVAAPEEAGDDVAAPEEAGDDVAAPEEAGDDVAAPEEAVEDVAAPEEAVEDVAAPEEAVEDVAAPEEAVEDVAAPEEAVEDVAAPEEAVEPTGEPIKVMTIAPRESNLPTYPNIFGTADVYEQYINDRGGVAGRPLEVIGCDAKGDPNEAAACAREAASEGVVAVLGHFEYDMSVAVPILEEAGIALLGSCCPVTPAEFSSPVNFIFGSTNAMQHSAVYKMADDGCQSPSIVYLENYFDYLKGLAGQAMEHFGVFEGNMRYASVPAQVGDYSPQAAEIDDADCVWLSLGAAHTGAFLAAMRTVGNDARPYGAQGNLTAEVAESYAELTEGGVVLNAYPNLVDPVWDEFRAALEDYDAPEASYNSLSGLGAWAAFVAFTDIAELVEGDITAATFLETVRAQDAYQSMWGPTIDLSVAEGPMPGFPRVLNFEITFDDVSGGVLSPTGEFIDFSEAVSGG